MAQHILKKSKTALKYSFVFNVATQALGLAAMVLLVRALSEHEYGVYNLLYSIIALISVVASFGIGNTLQRYIPEYYEKGEFRIANNLYRISSFIRLMANIVLLGLVLMLWEQIAPLFKLADYKSLFMIFSVVILLHMQRGLLETCLSSYFLHKYSKAAGFTFTLIKFIGYSLLILLDKNLLVAILVDLSAYMIVFTLLQIIYAKKIPHNTGSLERFSKAEKKRVSKYAIFYNFNDAGVGMLDANFDNFIIAMYLNPAAVGAYSFCVRASKQITRLLPLRYFLDVIRPAFFSVGTTSHQKNTTLFFQSLIKINAIFTIPCFCFLAIYSQDIISVVFGGKFLEYAAVLTGVFFFTAINSFQPAIGLVAQLREKADIILYSKIFAAYNLLADIVLIKMFGIWGAVIATGTATLGKNLFIWFFVRSEASFKGMAPFFGKIILFWFAFSIGLLWIHSWVILKPTFSLALGVLIFTLLFLLQFKLDYFNKSEKVVIGEAAGQTPAAVAMKRLLQI